MEDCPMSFERLRDSGP